MAATTKGRFEEHKNVRTRVDHMGEFEENYKLKVLYSLFKTWSGNQGVPVTPKNIFIFCTYSVDVTKIRLQLILWIVEFQQRSTLGFLL